jgi:redox-sensitive bicupin YhaK (pirin superfamily)
MKKVLGIYSIPDRHWVGDGFPVRTLFSYDTLGHRISPFLLLDFAGPAIFQAATTPWDVGQHPHRGFETVTIVYEGEVAHRDSTGQGGVIGPDDVQWMTAAGGILHEELPSSAFTRSGGPFRMVQLWVNLPVKDKTSPPKYQSILDTDIPSVDLPQGAGRARVIAGDFGGVCGPARTFAPINVWGLSLSAEKSAGGQDRVCAHLALPSDDLAAAVERRVQNAVRIFWSGIGRQGTAHARPTGKPGSHHQTIIR